RDAGRIRIGISAWTEPTLTAAGVFYPDGVSSAEGRLRYYASRFPLVEVDSSYYALPTAEMAERWVERTPDGFTFDVKAHAILTGHATEPARLPRALRDALPAALAARRRVRADELPTEVRDEAWRLFVRALDPLRDADKLGAVLLQFPPWFAPSRESARELVRAAERLEGLPAAIELRHAGWFEGRVAARTIEFLREHALPFVMVDEPQGFENSVPPVSAVTSPALAIVRLHGRRAATWTRATPRAVDRFRYLYDDAELREWIAPIRDAARAAREVHVVFNNCYGNYATTNALEFAALLADGGT
ncbi:MAG TPA: DUF72 domain-containing protein, partial [Gemmatimonadaceae bacterium]|nr:DUF72 domain-containing protein [Gemmatimonadaceae bacterium]